MRHKLVKPSAMLGVALLIIGCAEQKKQGLANPASQNCIKEGGTLQIQKLGSGGEYGVCYFLDNRQCEEWALLRGNCPVGGVKVTGYQTPGGVYCAISGGEVLENETQCKLPSGMVCSTQDLYQGKCH